MAAGNGKIGIIGALIAVVVTSVLWYVAAIQSLHGTRETLFARLSSIEERLGRMEERQEMDTKSIERLLLKQFQGLRSQ